MKGSNRLRRFLWTCFRYIPSNQVRVFLLRRLFGWSIGIGGSIHHSLSLEGIVDSAVSIGNGVFIGKGVVINLNWGARLNIGDGCLIGPSVGFFGAGYPVDAAGRLKSAASIEIDRDCWIAARSMIIGGGSLPAGSTLGGASVLTKRFEVKGFYCGNPAVLKRSFD